MSIYFAMDLCNSAEALWFMPTDFKFLLCFSLECLPSLLSDPSVSFSFPSIIISEALSHNTQSNQPELSVCSYNMLVQTKGEKAFRAVSIAFFIPVMDYLTIAHSSCFTARKVPSKNKKNIYIYWLAIKQCFPSVNENLWGIWFLDSCLSKQIQAGLWKLHFCKLLYKIKKIKHRACVT